MVKDGNIEKKNDDSREIYQKDKKKEGKKREKRKVERERKQRMTRILLGLDRG